MITETKITEALKEADKDVAILIKSTGQLEDGRPYWAYAAILPSRYKDLKQAEQQGNYNLDNFGDVLFWGYGEVPEEVRKEIEKILTSSESFETELLARVKQLMETQKPGFSDYLIARKIFGK